MAKADTTAIKERQQAAWASGDFSVIAVSTTIVGELLCESLDLHSGERVLDVACGSGNAAIAAARRFAEVTGVDYVPELLEQSRRRFAVEGLQGSFVVGDAEDIPFHDASFDVVMSTFGTMFAPDQERAAAELLRVCRPGGRIGLACWTPGGAVGQAFKTTASYAPPPPGLRPPVEWGTEPRLRELFADGISDLRAEQREAKFRFYSAEKFVNWFRTYFGPTIKAFEALSPEEADAFAADLVEVWNRFNRATDGTLVVPGEYLEVVATRG